ncbi:tRNA modification GTPase GTPBP3, mitochondrial [Diorhabda carinulata]|uniref:tRNA modification GTPase GTPBP3, mitochondrial n=1 Tax=Diorhabda carinulata TaxID=1163345 RepID=UPI0025A01C47|nr:tRNA modification GTPase GTPBP3, mitochondrial [Diorhabda carinulata]
MLWYKLNKYLNRYPARTLYSTKSDTIFALSSGYGKCGVAVIRISGSTSGTAFKLMTGLSVLPKPRVATLRSIKHPVSGETIDKGLILWFPGPKSFTGEDSLEFQVHGGIAVINSVLKALGTIRNLRLAEPGEFTRRAFFNGKLDLTEVEGLADLLQAETEAQRKQAFLQSQGALSNLYNKWKHILIQSVAHIEAHIDFEETETLEVNILTSVRQNIVSLAEDIEKHLLDGRKGEILRNGVRTIILGEPNVGKSSLLNLLCQRPAAIVTPIEGTTRDVLEVTLNIGGYPLVLADTAGLRANTLDLVEKEGINRALQLYEKSDFVILVLDAKKYSEWKEKAADGNFNRYIIDNVHKLKLKKLIEPRYVDNNVDIVFNKPCLIVLNKSDLWTENNIANNENCIKISCITENGIDELIEAVTHKLKELCGEPSSEHPSMNQIRHRQHLTNCLKHLKLFLAKNNSQNHDLVLMAEYLRKALRYLGKLVGSVTTDDLLDVIFKDFCIGK